MAGSSFLNSASGHQVSDGVEITDRHPKGLKPKVSIRKGLVMISARQVVMLIQKLPADAGCMRFLVSIADAAFKYGALSENQEIVFMQIIDAYKDTLESKEVAA